MKNCWLGWGREDRMNISQKGKVSKRRSRQGWEFDRLIGRKRKSLSWNVPSQIRRRILPRSTSGRAILHTKWILKPEPFDWYVTRPFWTKIHWEIAKKEYFNNFLSSSLSCAIWIMCSSLFQGFMVQACAHEEKGSPVLKEAEDLVIKDWSEISYRSPYQSLFG